MISMNMKLCDEILMQDNYSAIGANRCEIATSIMIIIEATWMICTTENYFVNDHELGVAPSVF
jgi:hypothetical protein